VFRLQVADSCSDIADAVLRLCLRSTGMPGNALASVLDDLPPLPGVTPASLLQATSYNSAQGLHALCPQPLFRECHVCTVC
jgi:hypothetical protein